MENQQQPAQPQFQSQIPQPPNPVTQSDGFQAMIPTKNVPSLVSYYSGVFSFIPFAGFVISIVGIVFGIKALKIVKVNPTPGAKVHAVIGIVLSALFLLLHVSFTILILASAA